MRAASNRPRKCTGSVEKYDTEYQGNGVSNLFMFFEPLAGQRYVTVTDQRTAVDWAQQIKRLVDDLDPQAEHITLVMDNLNTHTGASLYKAFSPEEARQCLDRRISDQDTLKKAVAAWQAARNALASPMEWRFTTEDARVKLKKLYPTVLNWLNARRND